MTGDPMTVAIGFPFFLDAASNLRFERVERQLADLRAQRDSGSDQRYGIM
jgi:hypothetical protein